MRKRKTAQPKKRRSSMGARRKVAAQLYADIVNGRCPFDPRRKRLQTAAEQAQKNLDKVVKALGARYIATPTNVGVHLRVARWTFYVTASAIYRCDGYCSTSTCYHTFDLDWLPPAEIIASALLLLHRNPKIFDHWKANPEEYMV